MLKNQTTHTFRGMKKDIGPLKASPEFLVDAKNIRLTPNIKDSLFSVTCERYPEPVAYLPLLDIVKQEGLNIISAENESITSCTVNNNLILFMVNNVVLSKTNYSEEAEFIYKCGELINAVDNAEVLEDIKGNEDLKSIYNTIYNYLYVDNIRTLDDVVYKFVQDTINVLDFIMQKNATLEFTKEQLKENNLSSRLKEMQDRYGGITTKYKYNSIVGINISTLKYLVLFTGYKNLDTGEEYNYLNLGDNIDLLPYYENNEIQKVYWVDGVNQPRMININADPETRSKWNSESFNFIAKPELKENFSVEKLDQYGIFAPGTIQYCFTYFNKYGAESNIIDTSPLLYIKDRNKGNSPEDTVTSNNFKISIANPDTSFSHARVYSIHRTSLNSNVACKVVGDLTLKNTEPTKEDITLNSHDSSTQYKLSFLNNSTIDRKIKITTSGTVFNSKEEYLEFLNTGEKCSVGEDTDGTIIIKLITYASYSEATTQQ